MALRVALVIDGDATGAKAAASETQAAVGGLVKNAAAASNAVAQSTRLTAQQLAQLQFQLQDVAVGLASGQSPFMVIAQQGSQIVQMLNGGGGVLAALRAVGSGVVAFLANPLNLAVLGFAAAAGAAQLFFNAVSGGAETADDLLDRHEKLIRRIRDAWPEAAEGVREYARESVRVLESELKADVVRLRATLASGVDEVIAEVTVGSGRLASKVVDPFAPFTAAIRDLQASARAGVPDIRAFRAAVAGIAATEPENAALQAVGARLIDLSAGADEAGRALGAAETAIRDIGRTSTGELQAVKAFGDALRALSGIALPRLDDRARAALEFDRALRAASGIEERQIAFTAYGETLKRITADEEAEAAAAAKGAAATAARTAASREAKAATEEEAAATKTLTDALAEAAGRMDELRSTAAGVFGSVANDIRRGASAGEILLNVLNRIGDYFIQKGAAGFGQLLFGPQGTAGGGLFGSLFGGGAPALSSIGAGIYHSGGVVGATAVPTRMMPAAAIAAAPRFHSGLGPREFPAILEEGEVVIPRGRSAGMSVTNVYVSTPDPKAFAQNRAAAVRGAGRLAARAARHL